MKYELKQQEHVYAKYSVRIFPERGLDSRSDPPPQYEGPTPCFCNEILFMQMALYLIFPRTRVAIVPTGQGVSLMSIQRQGH